MLGRCAATSNKLIFGVLHLNLALLRSALWATRALSSSVSTGLQLKGRRTSLYVTAIKGLGPTARLRFRVPNPCFSATPPRARTASPALLHTYCLIIVGGPKRHDTCILCYVCPLRFGIAYCDLPECAKTMSLSVCRNNDQGQ